MKLRWIAIPFVLIAPAAMGHVYRVVRGVHFKTESIDFGDPPRRFGLYFNDGMSDYSSWRPGTTYIYDWSDWKETDPTDEELAARRMKKAAIAYRHGRAAENARRYRDAESVYRSMLRRGMGDVAFLRARLELFQEVGIQDVPGLVRYLRATHPIVPRPLRSTPTEKGIAEPLRPFVAYERASTPDAFLTVAHEFPRSARAPAALIMAARILTREGGSRRKEDLRRADSACRTILARYPDSRFAWDARGGLGRIEFLQGRILPALRHYEIQVRIAGNDRQAGRALDSILLCARKTGRKDSVAEAALRRFALDRSRKSPFSAKGVLSDALSTFKAEDAKAFWSRIRRKPALLAAYLDYRLDFTEPTKDLLALSQPALAATARSPHHGHVLAQLARGALALKDANRARRFAQGAVAYGRDADDRATGEFVLASLERRVGRTAPARERYARIVDRYPKSYLAGGARENLALLDERSGDLAAALDAYETLGYEQDINYLIDARMSRAQLADYIRRRPHLRKRPILIYTLGMRHLRAADWNAAEATFARLTTRQRRSLAQGWESAQDDGGLQDPLATLRALRKLNATFERARGKEAKASALLAIADYYFRHHDLLLYSAPLWEGLRVAAFSFSWNGAVAQPADDRALARHHEEHETFAQALRRYQRVVNDFPGTKASFAAAYRGAVAAERLSDMAPYWRWREREVDHLGTATRLMRLASHSPDPVLAKRARKYGPVFRRERENARQAFATEKPPRRHFAREW